MAAKKVENTLMELVGQYNSVWEMINDPDVDAETVIDTVEGIEGEIEVKADGYGQIVRRIEVEIVGLDARAKQLKEWAKSLDAHKKALENKESRLKDHLMEAMIATGLDEKGIHTNSFDISVKTKGGVQELILDTEKVPEGFMKIIYEPDKDRIREYLKDNTCDWARLAPRGKRLEIK